MSTETPAANQPKTEEQERMERFEKVKKQKRGELEKVMNFLLGEMQLKTHNGILLQRSACKYFRGVNFHIAVLSAEKSIMQMIPTFVKEGSITQLKTLEDSIKLGTMMLMCQNILFLKKDPRIVQSEKEKCPRYVVPDRAPGMSDKGLYMVIESEESKSYQSFYLVLIVVGVIALMCFRLWPLWLKKGIWYISFYLLVFLVVTAILRVILWVILYHFGQEFWLFPNYWIDSNDPRDSFWPIYSYEIREDATDFKSIIFRLISGALMVYMGYQFCQDEKNMEDLRDLAENGLSDLFEYGQDFMIGNALGDGSEKKNRTEEPHQETFSEKYRKELKKDVDELGLDDDEDEDDYKNYDEDGEAKSTEAEEVEVDIDDDEEFVSSKDMFDEM